MRGVSKYSCERNTFRPVPCIIALDQSYARTGIAICVNGKVRSVSCLDFRKVKYNAEKRHQLRTKLEKAINVCLSHYAPHQIVIIVERIRTFTGSDSIRPEVIKSHAALISSIVDTAYLFDIKVYSVDTRAWKHAVLGSSKPVFEHLPGVTNPQKFGSVRKAIQLGFEHQLHATKRHSKEEEVIPTTSEYEEFYNYCKSFCSLNYDCSYLEKIGAGHTYNYNDDMADAICMSLYPFAEPPYMLKLET